MWVMWGGGGAFDEQFEAFGTQNTWEYANLLLLFVSVLSANHGHCTRRLKRQPSISRYLP